MKVTKKLVDRINAELENYYVRVSTIKKNNIEKKGLIIIPLEGDERQLVCPTVYIDDFETYEQVFDYIKMHTEMTIPKFDLEKALSKEYILENVRACMVSDDNVILEQKDIAYRYFLDMAIIYKLVISPEDVPMLGSIMLTNDIIKKAGLKEEDLYAVTRKNRDYEIKTMFDMLVEMSDISESELREKGFELPDIYVITSTDKMYGASLIFTDMFKEIRENLDFNFYVIPSSIHELIIVPCLPQMNPEELLEMVKNVNATEVSPENKLTDSLYYLSQDGVSKIA